MTLSTHVLDTATGLPGAGMPVQVTRLVQETWQPVSESVTDGDGRAGGLVSSAEWGQGDWRLTFDVEAYSGAGAFFPCVVVEFRVRDGRHHHVPLLLSPYGYSTYRGT